jgi:hypothetical protein
MSGGKGKGLGMDREGGKEEEIGKGRSDMRRGKGKEIHCASCFERQRCMS